MARSCITFMSVSWTGSGCGSASARRKAEDMVSFNGGTEHVYSSHSVKKLPTKQNTILQCPKSARSRLTM